MPKSKTDTLAKKYPEIKNNSQALEWMANLSTITYEQALKLRDLLQPKCPHNSTFYIRCNPGNAGE